VWFAVVAVDAAAQKPNLIIALADDLVICCLQAPRYS
jgi:hypothetical protein